MTAAPRRVRVVGNSGAGKTTLARRAADALEVAHLELDEVFWQAGWLHRDPAEGRALVAAFLAGPGREGWVVDGNWRSRLLGMLDDEADLVVWLDLPRRVVMRRVLGRTLRRGLTRQPLWHGNRERLRNLLLRDPEQNVVLWAWTQHHAYRARYGALHAAQAVPPAASRTARPGATPSSGPSVLRLSSAREVDRWLRSLRRTG
ncbi:toxin [Cellulomonas marina]|uniref:Adenylate kinase n=1 Tax=Cellulomonas marina TaxID=988821 RepID=A0A1I0VBA1_9CELL|nr:toxin [Cellulomonas marina]GIG29209.1 hypothetical protein Cma02nite_18090 [Cellulomonas marina]SFA72866.1 Adenylate kinase [Cellulomonas marina]